jgi:hypothetical protein
MIILYVLAAIFLVILFLLTLNVHLIFIYNEEVKVTLQILCFRFDAISLFKKISEKGEDKEESLPVADESKQKRGKGNLAGFAQFLVRIARVIGLAIKEHFSKLKVDLKELSVSIGTDDAAKTALVTGGVIAAANGLCELLRQFSHFRCNNKKCFISPNFASEKSTFSIHLKLTTRIVSLIGVFFRSYFRLFEGKDVKNARNSVKTSH